MEQKQQHTKHKKDDLRFNVYYKIFKGGNPKQIETLIQAQKAEENPFKLLNSFGESLLTMAIIEHNADLVECLLKHGANVNMRNRLSFSPLGIACARNNENIVNILLAHRANVNQADIQGNTPLMVTVNENIIKKLLEAGASVTHTNKKRRYCAIRLPSQKPS